MAESINQRLRALSDQRDAVELQKLLDAIRAELGYTLTASATFDPASIATAVGETTTITVTGAALGDFAMASFSLDLAGVTLSAYVSAANTVAVRFANVGATNPTNLASGTLRVRVFPKSTNLTA